MPYIATKRRLIAGREYFRGDTVDTSALTIAKLGSLIRVGLLVQQDMAPEAGVAVTPAEPVPTPTESAEPTEEICPLCFKSFRRLESHIARVHNEESS